MQPLPPEAQPWFYYFARADELEQARPVVAYYLRHYAVNQAFAACKSCLQSNTKLKAFFNGELSKLQYVSERLKSVLVKDGINQLEAFALSVFARAYILDSRGLRTVSVAQTYYASAHFLDVLAAHEQADKSQLASYVDKSLFARRRAITIASCLAKAQQPQGPDTEFSSQFAQLISTKEVERQGPDPAELIIEALDSLVGEDKDGCLRKLQAAINIIGGSGERR